MNILLAIDSSDASKKAVQFVGSFLADGAADNAVTLFHVVESLPDYLLVRTAESSDENMFRKVADELNAGNKAEGQKLLDETRRRLLESGVPEAALKTKLAVKDALPEAKKVIAALAIIEEMQAAPYDVVCLGRRGTSASAGVFPGSVAEKVLREGQGRTIWVVD